MNPTGVLLKNEQLTTSIYRMTVQGQYEGAMGQFYMLRGDDPYRADGFPLLSRPLSIHDRTEESITFLYQVHGRGTAILSRLSAGQRICLEGPFGHGFPELQQPGRMALVGGGMGTAPLLLVARYYHHAAVFLGYSSEPFAVDSFEQAMSRPEQLKIVSDPVRSILEMVQPEQFDTIMACGPSRMLEALARRVDASALPRPRLYISIEKRMACGIGACLTCTVKTAKGNRRACCEGPVFRAEEVDWDDLHEL